MNHTYIVAQNALAVSVADELPAWREIEPRFRPFEVADGGELAGCDVMSVAVDITCGPLPRIVGEVVYEPEYGGIGFITSRALRLADGGIVMEFGHVSEHEPRLWMKMPQKLDRADIALAPDGDDNDAYFLSHALMIAYMLGTCGNGTLLIHSSAVAYDGKAFMFQGKSGTGKSTHAALWTKHIEGADLLNDDHPVIRIEADGTAMAYGSPWSGKTHCYRNVSALIGAFVRIVRGEVNELRKLPPLRAYASLTASVFFLPFLSEELRDMRHKMIERLAEGVACYEMHCRPDAEAAQVCRDGVVAQECQIRIIK